MLTPGVSAANFVEELLTIAVPPYNEETSNCRTNKDCIEKADAKYGGDFKYWLNLKEGFREAD